MQLIISRTKVMLAAWSDFFSANLRVLGGKIAPYLNGYPQRLTQEVTILPVKIELPADLPDLRDEFAAALRELGPVDEARRVLVQDTRRYSAAPRADAAPPRRAPPAPLTDPHVPGGLPPDPLHGFHGRERELLKKTRRLCGD